MNHELKSIIMEDNVMADHIFYIIPVDNLQIALDIALWKKRSQLFHIINRISFYELMAWEIRS